MALWVALLREFRMKIRSTLSMVVSAAVLPGCVSTKTYVDVYQIEWDINPANQSAENVGIRKLRSRSYRNQAPSEVVLYGYAANNPGKRL